MKKTANLRLKGRQWQFVKKLPADVHAQVGKAWMVKNLGTADVLKAMRLRDRLLVELEQLVYSARMGVVDSEAAILGELEGLSPDDRQSIEHHLQDKAEARGDPDGGVEWYKRVTGQAVPISLHVDRFLRECPAVPTTQAARRSTIERFEVWLRQEKGGSSHLKAVSKKTAGAFASALTEQGLAQKTVNCHLSYLSSYWRWMVKRGLVEVNVWAGQQVVTKGSSRARLAWTLEEVADLVGRAPTRLLRHAIAIAALSGLRAGELTKLKVADCRDGVFNIRAGKTDAATRKVPIHSYLGAIIEARIASRRDDEYLLAELKGNPKGIVKRFARFRASAFGKTEGQASKTFHSLRHTFVTEALRAGCDLYIVQSCVGHVPAGVTLSVYHKGPSIEQLRAVVESVPGSI